MKLNENQKRILDKMSNGWQLGQSTTMDSRCWLQLGGCGCGGESQDVNSKSVFALQSRGLIEVDKHDFPLRTFRLTIDPNSD